MTLIVIVVALGLSGSWQGACFVVNQLTRAFIDTNQGRCSWGCSYKVKTSSIRHTKSAHLSNAPLLFQPGLELFFFRVRRTFRRQCHRPPAVARVARLTVASSTLDGHRHQLLRLTMLLPCRQVCACVQGGTVQSVRLQVHV